MNGEVTVLTAPGRGAVAVIHLSAGSLRTAVDVLNRHFQCLSKVSSLNDVPIGRILYGRWGHEDLVVVRTAAAEWEIHCHGGTAAVGSVVQDLNNSLRDFRGDRDPPAPHVAPALHGDPGLLDDRITSRKIAAEDKGLKAVAGNTIAAEVHRLLLKARTRRTAAHLLAQLTSHDPDECGRLEAEVRVIAGMPPGAERQTKLETLLQWSEFARHLTEPWRILLLGPPNAGKSSLVNVLAGFERSIVYDQPGTTRDLLEAATILDQWPMVFLDSAGVRTGSMDEIEREGILNSLAAVGTADACLLVADSSRPDVAEQFFSDIDFSFRRPVALILNKADLLNSDEMHVVRNRLSHIAEKRLSLPPQRDVPCFATSVNTGEGIESVQRWVVGALIPVEPPLGTALPLPEVIAAFF